MADIGKAYVQIVPTAKGISNDIEGLIGGDVQKSGESAGKAFGSKMVGAIGKVAAVVGVGKLFADAIGAGKELEQSFGGLDTIYGDAAEGAKDYAYQAAQAGISANDYAEQAVSMGAALKQAFGGDTNAAMEAANTAIMDMTDNAAKMGTPIESIQNAYQGFAKGNYTMLDNLKLGYGGTKEEMERLLADAEKLPAAMGRDFDLSNLGDVYDAIHLIQGNLGLTGVAADEAKTTFEGSFNAMKASAQNLMADLATGADIGPSLSALGDSIGNFVIGNLLPMISNIVQQIPTILAQLPGFLAELIPQAVPVIGEMVAGLAQGIVDNLPVWIAGVQQLWSTLWDTLTNIDWDSAGQFIADAIVQGWELLKETAAAIWDTVVGIFTGEVQFPDLSGAASAIWEALKTVASEIWDGVVFFFTQVITWPNICAAAEVVWNGLTSLASTIWDGVVEFFTQEIDWADITAGAKAIWDNLVNIAGNIWDSVVEYFTQDISWPDLAAGAKAVWDGLVAAAEAVWNAVKDWFCKTFDFPSLDAFASAAWNTLTGIASGIWEGIKAIFGALDITFSDLSGVAGEVWNGLKTVATGVWDTIKEIFGSFDIEWPDFGELAKGALEGLKSAAEGVWNWIKGLFSGDESEEAVKQVQGSTSEMAAALADAELKISSVDVSSIQTANEFVKQTVLGWVRMFEGIAFKLPTVESSSLAACAQVITSWVKTYKGKMEFTWSLPTLHGHLPVISVNMRSASSSDGSTTVNYPELSVSSFKWFKEGGVFSDPTIIGIGDTKGPEAAVPLDMMWKRLGQEFDEHMAQGPSITNYWNVTAADDPVEFADSVARQLRQQLRMA